ncbi:hypothetical protein FOL47_007361 [Perkinsus chesapeaki]|uniref:Uncharacterized protein n=1 Tax=Perkinsus chesapeaki TaxID=330153 RepID=A0A7J6LLD9_PERCH|nr:hypothetical protein FOL47_007361 [Perkinsus chesapeaki]
MVSAKNGSILVDLGAYMDIQFNETLFLSSVSSFLGTYKVDGFIVRLSPYNMDNIMNLTKVVHAISNRSVAALGFETSYWQEVKKANLTEHANMSFASLWPNDKGDTATFNTEEYAKSVIKNATSAGVANRSLVVEIPLLARSNYGSDDVGYSSMIFDFNADPHGNGTVVVNATTGDMYYFISQSQAVKRGQLSDALHLHGVMLQGNQEFQEDLYPWDNRSVCYGLAHR